MKPQSGEVWFLDFDYDEKPRNGLVLATAQDARLALASVVTITTQFGGTRYEVTLPRVPWLREQSYINARAFNPSASLNLRARRRGSSIPSCWHPSAKRCAFGCNSKTRPAPSAPRP